MADPFSDIDLDQLATGSLARILATTDGAIVTILEAYVGEPVGVVKLSQAVEAGDSQSPELPIQPGEQVLRRSVLLRGTHTGVNYLYADCMLRADRLPPGVLGELVATATPLRRVLAGHRIGTFEELISARRETAGTCARHFDVPNGAGMIARCHRIVIEGEPVILVTERFPIDLFS